ncbi:MAG: ABC transporter permease [Chthoniobacterales bacterium]|nr:ABC transporter permease [Chthoniobacterales bacterium]
MSGAFVRAFQCEWLKKKRSLASWLVVAGSFFTPAIVIAARLVNHDGLHQMYSAAGFWKELWKNSWESTAIFFLPMGAILATSLVTQIEFKNNTWKQVHALPLSLTTIFFAKLVVVILMLIQFFVLFNVAIYLSALVPYLLVSGVPYPKGPIPLAEFLADDLLYLVDCLPLVAAQYMLSLRFRNFLIPVGVGFMIWVGALASLSWKFGFAIPYSYPMLNYLKHDGGRKAVIPPVNIHAWAIGYFVLFTAIGFCLFVTKREKG